MTHFLRIAPQQEPFDLGAVDEAGRAQFAFNVLATKRTSDAWLTELVAVLEASEPPLGAPVVGGKTIPPTSGAYVWVRATGGTAPQGTLEDPAAYRRPGGQIIAHADDAADAEALAHAAYAACLRVRNTAVQAGGN